MLLILASLLILVAVFGPQIWAQRVLARHGRPRDDLAETGGQFARQLLDDLRLSDIGVEATSGGDHYSPMEKVVRLSRTNWGNNSLTAHVVAAHEVGHAVQHATGFRPHHTRMRLVRGGQWIQKVGVVLIMTLPLIAILTRSPRIGFLTFLIGLTMLGSSVVIHLVTLPVEWDASFRRALPILAAKGHLRAEDQPAAREILTACALTYVAASLASLLHLGRWLAILRR